MQDVNRIAGPKFGRTRLDGLLGWAGLLVLLLLGVGTLLLPMQTWLQPGPAIKTQLDGLGLAAPLVFVVGAGALTAVGAPRLLLCSLAGMAFGISWGIVWSQLATLLGAYGTFVAVRRCGQASILRRYPGLERFSDRAGGRGFVAVLLIRQLPMNGFYNNLLLGISAVSHGDFLAGSLLGYLPLGITAVLIGAGVVHGSLTAIIQYSLGAMAVFVVLGFLLHRLINAAVKRRTQPLSVRNGVE